MPDDLPNALQGSFGLVWDGDSSETCKGSFGNYLRINNSHKASLYLASGFPLVVWKESALAHFVLDKQCGIAIDSLHDLQKALDDLTDQDYMELSANARQVGVAIRSGDYLKSAISKLK